MIELMLDRNIVTKGLKEYLKCPVIRSNQNAEPPSYPYVVYTITTLATENKGTHGEYEDGKARKGVNTICSISAVSDDNAESVILANKAREWLDYVGTSYLGENGIIVEKVTSVTNRDNLLTVDYEYKNGFDCFFWSFDVVDIPDNGEITSVELQNVKTAEKVDYEQKINDLTDELDKANADIDNLNGEVSRLEEQNNALQTEYNEFSAQVKDLVNELEDVLYSPYYIPPVPF